jgi:thiol-disulfide isomerase/thioredoxin
MADDVIRSAFDLLRREPPVEPPAGFAGDLFARLVAERDRGVAGVPGPGPRRHGFSARVLALAAAAIALAVALAALVVLPRPETALAIVREAQDKLADVPPFQATVVYDLNPEGATTGIPSAETGIPGGATATLRLSYRSPASYRQEIVDERSILSNSGLPTTGSFLVWDGERIGDYRATENTFVTYAPPEGFEPLREFSWNAPYPNWEDICRRGGSQVLPDGVIAGRDARHVRCTGQPIGTWDLWVDRETGLVLKVVGAIGSDDLHPFPTTEAGGFEVTEIRYGASFAEGTFTVRPPAGATATEAPSQDGGGQADEGGAEEDPFSEVSLAPGEPAPLWTGTTADGRPFDLADTSGQPVLVLFFADWCPPGDPVCDALLAFQEAAGRLGDDVTFVWLDLQGTEAEARRIVSDRGYTVPAVLSDAATEAWGVHAFPVWVLLDAEGRTVDVRVGPLTAGAIDELVAEAG